ARPTPSPSITPEPEGGPLEASFCAWMRHAIAPVSTTAKTTTTTTTRFIVSLRRVAVRRTCQRAEPSPRRAAGRSRQDLEARAAGGPDRGPGPARAERVAPALPSEAAHAARPRTGAPGAP